MTNDKIKTIKIIREIKMYGTSLGIRLGMDTVSQLSLKEGDVIEVVINKLDRFSESDRYVIHCDTSIIVRGDEDVINCPICGEELIVNNMEVKEAK